LKKYNKKELITSKIIGSVLFTDSDIKKRVKELGKQITEDYRGRDLMLVSILRGGIIFLSDLARNIDLPISLDFMGISTYGINDDSTGVVRITKDLEDPIKGKDVLLVEDIIDTGLTISYLMRNLKSRYPESLTICTLLNRDVRRIADIEIKYSGFKIGEKYIVGYGLDYKQKFRNLEAIHELNIDTVKKDIESLKNTSNSRII
jgi:hypoxanthine phosphoribosyltransferase